MKIVLTLLVRDEEDIIRQNILYHLQMGVDFIIATDNKSKDGTSDILREFEKQNVLHIIKEEQDNYAQSMWVSKMANLAKTRFNADWVINCDADEFWWPKTGNLSDSLQQIPNEYDVVSALRKNFIPRISGKTTSWYHLMIYREKKPRNPLGKPLLPKVFHRGIENIKIAHGNHSILWPEKQAMLPDFPLDIFHFPMRSYLQFENKIAKGGAAIERNIDLPKSDGNTWNKLYDLYKNRKLHEYYEKQIWSEERIQEGLDNGSITKDTRLKNFFATHAIE